MDCHYQLLASLVIMFEKLKKYLNFDKNQRSNKWIFTTILVTSLLGLLAAFVLSTEAIDLLKDPNAQFSCSLNAVVNCATVAKTSYSSIFGFPNSFMGMMVMPIFVTTAIIGLFGMKPPKLFMLGIQIAAVFALIFAFYLFHISIVVIQVLCPWCLLVDVTTIIMFAAITRYNINENNLYLPNKYQNFAKKFIKNDFDKFAAALLIVAGAAVIVIKFGSSLFA